MFVQKPLLEPQAESQDTINASEETPLIQVPIEEEESDLSTSTFRQTIINSLNLLMGMGLLSLPFAFASLGWFLGLGLLFCFCVIAGFTAHLIGTLMKSSRKSIMGVAHDAFGRSGEVFIGVMFSLELFTAGVAMLILFADSLISLVPNWEPFKSQFMVGAAIFLTPLTWQRSLSKLTWLSFVGVVSLVMLITSVFWNGMVVEHGPGSILHPAETFWWPQGWNEIGLGIGLLFVGLDGKD
jgi:amino acid permease